MKHKDSLSIIILDKEYRVACPPGEEESLQASANELNKKLSEIKRKGAVIGTERIAIMAALNICHEMLTGKTIETEYADLNSRIESLSEKIDSSMREIQLS
ncbi:MAG: cell division protein ZapA [Gammaproteobacteria bacterium]|jgi:cell division protein ZapA